MTELDHTEIQENFQRVSAEIAETAIAAGRNPSDVRLVTVTKTHPVESIRAVVVAGAVHLGENRVEEASQKIPVLADLPEIQWHMIGHIQSRKAAAVVEHFDWAHSLDTVKLARRLSSFAVAAGRVLPVLLEFNVSGEESKSGWPAYQQNMWPQLLDQLEQVLAFPGIRVHGLMTMAPYNPDPEAARPVFIKLRQLRDDLAAQFPENDFSQLSMGMSGDYQVAIQEGATIVRIGTAIFGARTYNLH